MCWEDFSKTYVDWGADVHLALRSRSMRSVSRSFSSVSICDDAVMKLSSSTATETCGDESEKLKEQQA